MPLRERCAYANCVANLSVVKLCANRSSRDSTLRGLETPFPPLYLSVNDEKFETYTDSDKFNIRMLRDEEELIPKVEWIKREESSSQARLVELTS